MGAVGQGQIWCDSKYFIDFIIFWVLFNFLYFYVKNCKIIPDQKQMQKKKKLK